MKKNVIIFVINSILLSSVLFGQIKGKLYTIDTFKTNLISPRRVDIWMPNDYTPKKRYAVIYMHDGQMLFDATKTWNKQEWGVDDNLDSLLQTNQIKDVIVVAIWNISAERYMNYVPQRVFENFDQNIKDTLFKKNNNYPPYANNYLKFLVNELKPFIDKNYSTLTDKTHTIIGGSSMGGLISLYAICEYPNVFGTALCFSTHFPMLLHKKSIHENTSFNAMFNYVQSKIDVIKQNKIYFDFGTKTLDSNYEEYHQKIIDVFRLNKIENFICIKSIGDEHNEIAWKKRFSLGVLFALQNSFALPDFKKKIQGNGYQLLE